MKKWLSYTILCLLIPAVLVGGAWLFRDKYLAFITISVTVLSCLPFFIRFERKDTDVKRLIMIAVMIALSVIGRILFAPLQGFKPVTAMVIITAVYFGSEAGFMTGALTALISNFYFGHGPWTPFQMFSWGMIGLAAGLLARPIQHSRVVQVIAGALSGVVYSLLMDVYTVLWADGFFNVPRYLASMASALPFTAMYAVSNVIFLLLFMKPIGRILGRMKEKYGL